MDASLAASSSAAAPRQNPSYIPTLDGWRAIAILLVIGAHSTIMLSNSGTQVGGWLASAFSHAGVGVDIFFALSGFLICSLLLREQSARGGISLRSFYVRRAFRILPPILVYLLTLLVLRATNVLPVVELDELAAVLLFVRNYMAGGSWYTGHFWSLAVEEHFYLVVPCLLLIRSRRVLACAFAALIAACIAIRAFEFSHADLFSGSQIQFRTENRFDALSWGGLLALLLHDDRARRWVKTNVKGWMVVAVSLVVFGLLQIESQGLRRTLVAATLPLMIGYAVLHSGGVLGRVLEWPLLRSIGKLSYSLYIWQMMFLVPTERPLGLLQAFPLAFAASLGCAMASYHLVEKPSIRIGHRLSAGFSARRTVPAG